MIILTVEDDQEIAMDVIRRGAAAYVPKYVRPDDLAALVRQVAGGAVLMGGSRLAGAWGACPRRLPVEKAQNRRSRSTASLRGSWRCSTLSPRARATPT